MIALVDASPATNLHVIDLPYRLCSPSATVADNVRLWEGADGSLLAWAVWQQPWITLDYAVHPDEAGTIETEIIAWTLDRFRAMAREHGRVLSYFIDAREDDPARIALLERHGFVRADWCALHLTRTLETPLPWPSLPEGFTIRHLAGAEDLQGYVALHRIAFESTSMTAEWKTGITRMPQYIPDLDLVAVTPDGRFAAFCVSWLHGDAGQIEPLGVHSDFAGQGLGRTLLAEAFRRLQKRGVATAHIEVSNDNPRARHLDESAGFRAAHRIWKYERKV